MERHIFWAPWNEPGLEHLHLRQRDDRIIANGLIIGLADGIPFRAGYTIMCDLEWKVQVVRVELLNSERKIRLIADEEEDHWVGNAYEPLPLLNGCRDVDISVTPFTNTLPIRRLNLAVGQSAELSVIYIKVPELDVMPVQQRYTYLEEKPDRKLYNYEGLSSHFTANLTIDNDGLVIDYAGVFKRIWPNEPERSV